MSKSLADLITDAQNLLREISQHPDYKSLLEKGYCPDLTLGDADTALTYLWWEVAPPAPDIPEVEVKG